MAEVQKLEVFSFFDIPARPSAKIGAVEVQKLEVFLVFFDMPARPSAKIGVVEVQKLEVCLRFLRCPRNPLRRSAWSRCKNSRLFFFAFFAVPAQPSAEIGVVEVQRLVAFLAVPWDPLGIGVVEALSLWRRANSS